MFQKNNLWFQRIKAFEEILIKECILKDEEDKTLYSVPGLNKNWTTTISTVVCKAYKSVCKYDLAITCLQGQLKAMFVTTMWQREVTDILYKSCSYSIIKDGCLFSISSKYKNNTPIFMSGNRLCSDSIYKGEVLQMYWYSYHCFCNLSHKMLYCSIPKIA